MNLILAGLRRVLVQLSVTFVVLGTVYLLLFAPSTDGPMRLPSEQVAANLAPIGRVQIAESPESIPAASPAPTPTPASASTPALKPDKDSDSAMDKAAIAAPDEPIAAGRGEPASVVAAAPVAVAAEADVPHADLTPIQVQVAVPQPSPAARVAAPSADNTLEVSIRLYPDPNGMHGSFRLTPEGFILSPASMIGQNTHLLPMERIKGSFRATPSGVAHFRLQPTAPVD